MKQRTLSDLELLKVLKVLRRGILVLSLGEGKEFLFGR
jgi:hypothetical protein